MRQRFPQYRLWVILGAILLLLGVIGWRLFDVAWLRHDWYAQAARAQAAGASNILVRGNIFMSNGAGQPFLVATNHESVDEKGQAQTVRFYPAGSLAANVIGFFGYDDQGQRAGQYGIEGSYNAQLAGVGPVSQTQSGLIGHLGSLLGMGTGAGTDTSVHPMDVELTIDKNVQAYVEGALSAVLKKYHAASGAIVVQDPSSGAIMAMTSSPSFDPNHYSDSSIASFANEAIAPFEPGSSFKPITMAMGLDLGKVTPTSTFNDAGDVVVDGYTIKNFNSGHFGVVTMSQILEKSINTGAMYVQSLMTHDQFLHYVVDMGFGQRTGIDLPGEAPGSLDNLYTNRNINFMTASFGQGITTTPIQMVTAFSAIANGGKLMKPYVVDALRDPDTGAEKKTQPEVVGTPFTAATAAALRSMLVSVVDNGFDKARIAHYDVAGKTGTAQIASPTGGYLEGQYNHSFVGFAPGKDPRFVIFIRMEKPQGITYASDSLSSTFRDIALFLLNYLGIAPTR